MTFLRHIRCRILLLALVGLAVIGTGAAFAATRAKPQQIGSGVVVIDTTLGYQGSQAAGTGMVLTSNGEVLTNNHVIAGATAITVVVPGTAHRYTARVVGYDVSDDVAVLRLVHASNLRTITAATSTPKVGAAVTAVGNAGGTGRLLSARGSVTGLGKTITASDDNGRSEQLTGLIETDANVQPGDSGGPLLDSAGRVVGMDTAGSTGSMPFAAYGGTDAYAIPIGKALAVARQIAAGKASATVHVGATAFLGIEVGDLGYESGALLAGVVPGGSADSAGLVAGDVITSIAGRRVSSSADVETIVLSLRPGRKVAIGYVDATGAAGMAVLMPTSGPAQ